MAALVPLGMALVGGTWALAGPQEESARPDCEQRLVTKAALLDAEQQLGAEPAPWDASAGPAPAEKATDNELVRERLATLRGLVKVTTTEYRAGRVPFDRLLLAMRASGCRA